MFRRPQMHKPRTPQADRDQRPKGPHRYCKLQRRPGLPKLSRCSHRSSLSGRAPLSTPPSRPPQSRLGSRDSQNSSKSSNSGAALVTPPPKAPVSTAQLTPEGHTAGRPPAPRRPDSIPRTPIQTPGALSDRSAALSHRPGPPHTHSLACPCQAARSQTPPQLRHGPPAHSSLPLSAGKPPRTPAAARTPSISRASATLNNPITTPPPPVAPRAAFATKAGISSRLGMPSRGSPAQPAPPQACASAPYRLPRYRA